MISNCSARACIYRMDLPASSEGGRLGDEAIKTELDGAEYSRRGLAVDQKAKKPLIQPITGT
jgi:hypothetical protein